MLHQQATQDNSIDWQCLAGRNLKEDIDHILQCPSSQQSDSQDKAQHQFKMHLSQYYTPAPMAEVILQALDHWFSNLQPNFVPRLPTGPDEPNWHLHQLINEAFVHQNNIEWGHFLWGCLLLHWKLWIAEYYRHHQQGDTYNPHLWMTKTVDAVWNLFLTIWTTWNGELYGRDYDEQWAIVLAMTQSEVTKIYEKSKHYANGAEHAILHAKPLEEILRWTKAHLDAYLATAEVILEQKIDPGWFTYPLMPMLEQGGKQGGGRYHNSVKTGINKNSVVISLDGIPGCVYWVRMWVWLFLCCQCDCGVLCHCMQYWFGGFFAILSEPHWPFLVELFEVICDEAVLPVFSFCFVSAIWW